MTRTTLQQKSLEELRELLNIPTNTITNMAAIEADIDVLEAAMTAAQADIAALEAQQGMLWADAVVVASDAPAEDIAVAQALAILYPTRIYYCDGVADDVQVNAAIAALPAHGGIVRLTGGTFYCADSVATVHDLTLMGAGVDVTILKMADGANIQTGVIYANGNFNRGVMMEFSVDGNKTGSPSGKFGVYLRGVWYARIVHIAIHDCLEDGFRSTTTAGGTYCGEIYHEEVSSYNNEKDGFALAGSGDNFLVDCYAYGNGQIGFHASMTHNAMFHCHPYDNTMHGISLDNTSDHNGLFDCCLDMNHMHGLYMQGDYNRVIGSYFYANSQGAAGTYDGVRVTGTYNTIIGSLCRDPQGIKTQAYGIRESGSPAYNHYIGNIVNENLTGQMLLTAESSRASMNIGYIAPGEIRTGYKALTAGNANAISLAWENPELQDVWIRKVATEVGTPGGTGGSHLDMGVADDATGTNRGAEFFNDLLLNEAKMNDSWLAGDGGTQTKWVKVKANGTATDSFVVGQILDANAAALAGGAYVEYCGAA